MGGLNFVEEGVGGGVGEEWEEKWEGESVVM